MLLKRARPRHDKQFLVQSDIIKITFIRANYNVVGIYYHSMRLYFIDNRIKYIKNININLISYFTIQLCKYRFSSIFSVLNVFIPHAVHINTVINFYQLPFLKRDIY